MLDSRERQKTPARCASRMPLTPVQTVQEIGAWRPKPQHKAGDWRSVRTIRKFRIVRALRHFSWPFGCPLRNRASRTRQLAGRLAPAETAWEHPSIPQRFPTKPINPSRAATSKPKAATENLYRASPAPRKTRQRWRAPDLNARTKTKTPNRLEPIRGAVIKTPTITKEL